jgi:hypothetical protein
MEIAPVMPRMLAITPFRRLAAERLRRRRLLSLIGIV